MDENAIFKDPSEIDGKNQNNKEPENLTDSSPNPTFFQNPDSPIKPFNILKILLGIAVILVVIFLIFTFILPRFFGGLENKITLTYWGISEESEEMQPIIDDFEEENPNIKIEYSKQDINQYREKLVVRSNNGNGPDIFAFHNTWVPMLSDLLLPLPSSVISNDDFSKNYYPVIRNDLIRNGAIYGLPLQIDTLNLFINKELFQAAGLRAPSTWIEFVDYSRQLTVKDENNNIITAGASMGTFNNITNAPDIISMLFVQNGANLENMPSNLNASSEALNFYTSFAIPASNVWDNTLNEATEMFASGSLAMYFGYSRDFFAIKSLSPNLAFEVHPVPSLPERNITIASYWVNGVSSKSRQQKEAFLFMEYLGRRETSEKLFQEKSKTKGFGDPYARIDLAETLQNSLIYPFVENADSSISSFFAGGTFDNGLNSEANIQLGNAVNSILDGTSPESATETLSQSIAEILSKYESPLEN